MTHDQPKQQLVLKTSIDKTEGQLLVFGPASIFALITILAVGASAPRPTKPGYGLVAICLIGLTIITIALFYKFFTALLYAPEKMATLETHNARGTWDRLILSGRSFAWVTTNETIDFGGITETSVEKDVFDHRFGTGTLVLKLRLGTGEHSLQQAVRIEGVDNPDAVQRIIDAQRTNGIFSF